MKIFIIFILTLLVNQLISLKTSDLCQIDSEISELKVKCLDMHKIRCNSQYCAIDETTCKEFVNLSVYMESARKEEKKILKKLIQNIKRCPRNEYKWQASDICLSSFTCQKKSTIVSHRKAGLVLSVKKTIYCPCSSKHDYLCDIKYCASNKEACDEFKAFKNETEIINKCIQ